MRILALDPATRCGWAYTDGEQTVYGVWDLGISGSEHAGKRLVRLRDRLLDLHERHGIDRIAYEAASFGSHNPNTQAFHNELAGIIRMVAADLGVPAVPYPIGTIKKFATGSGVAKKPQMVRACKTILGIETEDDNVADALFVLELAKQGVRPEPVAEPSKRTVLYRRGKKLF